MTFSDLPLARQLERTEASSNAALVETRARLYPASGAAWRSVGGAYALFDGPASPLTQTFGLGLYEETTADDLDQIEAFFAERHAPVLHEVSPMGHANLLPLLTGRGYRPVEYTSVLYRELGRTTVPLAGPLTTRRVAAHEAETWASAAAQGWAAEAPELVAFILELGRLSANSVGMQCFIAEQDGQPIATAGLFVHGGVALLAGASTVPAGRRQGAQAALLAARLHTAVVQGCTVAMLGALPGSQSQRNAERQGFRTAYTRTKWQLP